ncbi:Hypothetical protein BRZCDTV_215, partial [Brazilian cedratvirus IHUMI]
LYEKREQRLVPSSSFVTLGEERERAKENDWYLVVPSSSFVTLGENEVLTLGEERTIGTLFAFSLLLTQSRTRVPLLSSTKITSGYLCSTKLERRVFTACLELG